MAILTRSNVDFDRFEIVKQGLMTVSKGSSSSSAAEPIEHELDFKPAFLAFYEFGDQRITLPFYGAEATGAATLSINFAITFTTDGTYATGSIQVGGSGTYFTNPMTANIRYYLLKDRASS